MQSDRKIAIKLLEDAVRINPYYLSAVLNLAKHYMELGRVEDALKLYVDHSFLCRALTNIFCRLLKANERFDYQFMHKMIIDCYNKLGQEEKAIMHETAR